MLDKDSVFPIRMGIKMFYQQVMMIIIVSSTLSYELQVIILAIT